MAARGYPRFTIDVDLLTTDGRVLEPGVWAALAHEGATVEARRGDVDDHGINVRLDLVDDDVAVAECQQSRRIVQVEIAACSRPDVHDAWRQLVA
jgi:hypothetical protein